MRNKLFYGVTLFLSLLFCSSFAEGQKPKNLIIFIGDGMGVSQVYSGLTASGFNMTFPFFPVTGFSITYSLNSYITDSAAGGTALATGEKTNNGMVAMRPDTTEIPTILEVAKQNGLSTGIVVTSSLTNATPADFATHCISRRREDDIAKSYLRGAADVFIGGGKNRFLNRGDSMDLTLQLKKMGYDVVCNMSDLKKSESSHLAGLFADDALPYIADGRDTNYLADATSRAIEILSKNQKGFVLMVEGSEIDFAAHENNFDKMVKEVLDLDRAVKRAYDFAVSDGKTLIVVTADHETGGLANVGGNIADKKVIGNFITHEHSATMVPVFSYGPGSLNFAGIQQNIQINKKCRKLLHLK